MAHYPGRLRKPKKCPQCESLVFEYREWRPDLFSRAASFMCSGCGYEIWESMNDLGQLIRGEVWATCGCCGRVLRSGNAALNGYGERCLSGKCHCNGRTHRGRSRVEFL